MVIKTGTSRSSASTFILSPLGAEALLLECVPGCKLVYKPVKNDYMENKISYRLPRGYISKQLLYIKDRI